MPRTAGRAPPRESASGAIVFRAVATRVTNATLRWCVRTRTPRAMYSRTPPE